jgi:hypothetical protein
MDALINNCLKPVASTLPLATDEIKRMQHFDQNKEDFGKLSEISS